MESVEVSAKTVDEAIDIALEDLGLKRSQVDIEVLTPGKPGLFGLGGEQARVRVTALEGVEVQRHEPEHEPEVRGEVREEVFPESEIEVKPSPQRVIQVLSEVRGANDNSGGFRVLQLLEKGDNDSV